METKPLRTPDLDMIMNVFKMSLSWQMAVATLLGILCGLFFGDLCKVFSPWATAYIMLLKVTTVPYLIGAIIHGLGQLSGSQAKEILKKGVIFIGLAWAINILMIYLSFFLFPHAKGSRYASYFVPETPQLNFAELLIPENIFYALSNNIIPAIVIFSVFIGISLMHMKEKTALMSSLQTLVNALTKITGWISRITPLGTFIIIANQVGTIQFSTIKQVSTYIILFILVTCLIVFWIFPSLTSMLTNITSYKWLKEMLPILLLAYTTNVVIVCLPYIINLIQRETEFLDPHDEKAQSSIQGTVSIIFNLPLGSLFITLYILFASLFYNTSLSLMNQLHLFLTTFLVSLGGVGLGSWINSVTFLLDSLGLPLEAIHLYVATLPFTAGFQSMISVIEISTLSLLITLSCRKLISFTWAKLIRGSLTIALPVLTVAFGIKLLDPLPKIQNPAKSICDLTIQSDTKVVLFSPGQKLPAPQNLSKDTFEDILERKTLRVGYNPNVMPFCFFNNDGELVGYDIANAYQLAKDLGCSLEFIPLEYSSLIEDLNQGLYDIAMSAVSMNEERLKYLSFTRPYIDAKIVFVTKDILRKEYSQLDNIYKNPELKIAVLKGSSYETLARNIFPADKIVLLDNYFSFKQKEYSQYALLWQEQEAINWITKDQSYSLVNPTPSLGIDSLAYAIRPGSPRFLNFLNQWLKLKENESFEEKQYNIWVLGKTQSIVIEEPRWSVIRNILHWIE